MRLGIRSAMHHTRLAQDWYKMSYLVLDSPARELATVGVLLHDHIVLVILFDSPCPGP